MKLGELIPNENENLGLKDAVHVAVVAAELSGDYSPKMVRPGQPVRFTGDALSKFRPCELGEKPHGIIDPFVDHVPDDGLVLILVRPSMLVGTMTHNWKIGFDEKDTGPDFESHQWDCRDCS